jgi:hypothetical protein
LFAIRSASSAPTRITVGEGRSDRRKAAMHLGCPGRRQRRKDRRRRSMAPLNRNDSHVSTRSVQGETTTAAAGSSIPSSRNCSMVAGCMLGAVLSCPICDRYGGREPFPEVALLAPRNRPDADVAVRALRQDQRSSFPKLFPAVRRLGVKRVRW